MLAFSLVIMTLLSLFTPPLVVARFFSMLMT
uniref:Uncharacterized protein n=1 Tax=Arundo donax TaxID=35708 RepID=A0A0A9GL38_ARUDO